MAGRHGICPLSMRPLPLPWRCTLPTCCSWRIWTTTTCLVRACFCGFVGSVSFWLLHGAQAPPSPRPFPAGAVPLQSFRRIPSAGFGSQPLGSLPPSISRSGVVLRKTRHTSPASHHSGSSRVGVMRRSASGGGGAPSNKSPPAPSAPPKSYRIVCARDRTTKRFSVPSSCTYEQFKTACCNSHVSHLIHVPFELSRCVLVLVFRFWFCCVAD